MIDLNPKYQVDERGQRFVILTEEEYENILAWIELKEPDPDNGLKVRKNVRAELEQELKDYDAGRLRGKSLEQLNQELESS